MLVDSNNKKIKSCRAWSADLSDADIEIIKAYIKGAVYDNCNTNQGGQFCAGSFAGDRNWYWDDTPLEKLWKYHYDSSDEDCDYAFDMARKDLGCLLKRVLIDDKRRTFKQEKNTRFNGALMYSYVEDIPDCTH